MKLNSRVKVNQSSCIGDLKFSDEPNDKYNPFDCEGTIINTNNPKVKTLPYIVLWDNGFTNSYEKCNLIEL